MAHNLNEDENYQSDQSSSQKPQIQNRGQIDLNSQEDDKQLEQGQIPDDIYDSSEDEERLNEQHKKREDFWKNQQEAQKNIKDVGEEEMLAYAYEAAANTNKKILTIRKRHHKRIEQLERIRMIQQNYLVGCNTHFRGSVNEYAVITSDRKGRSYFHPNQTMRVAELSLGSFIKKNIAEQNTSNYLNQVVKFENYAYQQRKKRKHNFE